MMLELGKLVFIAQAEVADLNISGGYSATVLADYHAILDELKAVKTAWEELNARARTRVKELNIARNVLGRTQRLDSIRKITEELSEEERKFADSLTQMMRLINSTTSPRSSSAIPAGR